MLFSNLMMTGCFPWVQDQRAITNKYNLLAACKGPWGHWGYPWQYPGVGCQWTPASDSSTRPHTCGTQCLPECVAHSAEPTWLWERKNYKNTIPQSFRQVSYKCQIRYKSCYVKKHCKIHCFWAYLKLVWNCIWNLSETCLKLATILHHFVLHLVQISLQLNRHCESTCLITCCTVTLLDST